jgi:hypothetical protein
MFGCRLGSFSGIRSISSRIFATSGSSTTGEPTFTSSVMRLPGVSPTGVTEAVTVSILISGSSDSSIVKNPFCFGISIRLAAITCFSFPGSLSDNICWSSSGCSIFYLSGSFSYFLLSFGPASSSESDSYSYRFGFGVIRS